MRIKNMKKLIFTTLMLTLVPDSYGNSKKLLPFLTEGEYEVISGQADVCFPGRVRFNKDSKILRVSAKFNFPVMNVKAETPDESLPGCKLVENHKFSQQSDHTVLDLEWNTVCAKKRDDARYDLVR